MIATELRPFLSRITAQLLKEGVLDAEISVLRVAEHVLGVPKRNFPKSLTSDQVSCINDLSHRRLRSEPLQYILGEWDFHNLHGIKCRPPCLIPRPETEQLVEKALATARCRLKSGADSSRSLSFLEIGVGTGAISIALLRELNDPQGTGGRSLLSCSTDDFASSSRDKGATGTAATPAHWQGFGIDVSLEAIELCRENASKFEVADSLHLLQCSAADLPKPQRVGSTANCTSHLASLLGADDTSGAASFRGFDFLVSNPPYIPSRYVAAAVMQPEVFCWEDHRALDGGVDGLDIIRDILKLASSTVDASCLQSESRDNGPLRKQGKSAATTQQPIPILKEGADIWLEVDGSHAHRIHEVVR